MVSNTPFRCDSAFGWQDYAVLKQQFNNTGMSRTRRWFERMFVVIKWSFGTCGGAFSHESCAETHLRNRYFVSGAAHLSRPCADLRP